jgi:hypothetical protein
LEQSYLRYYQEPFLSFGFCFGIGFGFYFGIDFGYGLLKNLWSLRFWVEFFIILLKPFLS